VLGNSARSILGEAILNHIGHDRFRGFSAGCHPHGAVNALTLKVLRQLQVPTGSLRSKSWDEFVGPDAPVMDFAITVCDRTAKETCPVWPGKPVAAQWGMPDPVAVTGSEIDQLQAFRESFRIIEKRIALFVSLRIEALDAVTLRNRLSEISTVNVRDRVAV
jgi:arsenate reductase